ncbi:MAG TPA: Omp28 family outer membrane lipoprotein [Tenuifilaceae bacterium]|nr:Omp28 family outer membrane lipoprotein [Tenuifilaceae bacterium]
MRILKYLFLIGFISFFSCDIIEEPYMNPVVQNPDSAEVVQKVLLEEFTGHQCPNCPGGAETATQLHQVYGDRFIVIAYHAGWFARTSDEFPVEYRTEVGEELNEQYGVLAYPSGLVNRTSVNSNILLNPAEWGAVTYDILENSPVLQLIVSKNYNQETKSLSVSVTSKTLQDVEEIKVCVFITEDDLISPQKTPDGVNNNYIHNHVFRTSLNGTWGTTIFEGGAGSEESQTIMVNAVLSAEWNINSLNIVCFAYNVISGEVIQVESIKLVE